MFIKYNNNPTGANIEDCYIRSLALATNTPYYDMMDELFAVADKAGSNENSIYNIAGVLIGRGWKMYQIDSRTTVNQLAKWLGDGRYVIICAGHATCAIDGDVYDTWNPNKYKALYYFSLDNK